MTIYNILGYSFNGLEFVTYVLIPVSIFLIILLYIGSNFKLILLAGELNKEIIAGVSSGDYHYNNYGINYEEEDINTLSEKLNKEEIEKNNIKEKKEIKTREKIQSSLKINI